jgi:hypothetical protein
VVTKEKINALSLSGIVNLTAIVAASFEESISRRATKAGALSNRYRMKRLELALVEEIDLSAGISVTNDG